jgi:hypothetical protein
VLNELIAAAKGAQHRHARAADEKPTPADADASVSHDLPVIPIGPGHRGLLA